MPDRSLTCSRAGVPPCPPKPAWFHRLDEIFTALRAMTSAHLDRAAVEKLFRVSPSIYKEPDFYKDSVASRCRSTSVAVGPVFPAAT